MEPSEREHITINLPALMELTAINSSLMAFCNANGILGRSDLDSINAKKNSTGNLSAAQLFYYTVQTRTGAYNIVLEALRKTRQTGAVQILEKLKNTESGVVSTQPGARTMTDLASMSDQPGPSRGFRFSNETVIGGRSCSCYCIVQKLEESTRAEEFFRDWENMANLMNISILKKSHYRAEVERKTCTPKDAFGGILRIWTNDQGTKATVKKLVDYIEKCGFGDVAGVLAELKGLQIVLEGERPLFKRGCLIC